MMGETLALCEAEEPLRRSFDRSLAGLLTRSERRATWQMLAEAELEITRRAATPASISDLRTALADYLTPAECDEAARRLGAAGLHVARA
jgi:hypothetical protein